MISITVIYHRPFMMAPGENPKSFFDEFFNEDFFGRSRDPFEEMRRMQKRFGGEVGELKQREEQGTSSYYSSSFQRSFPIPPRVDAEKFTMEQEDKKIVIKFPKIKA